MLTFPAACLKAHQNRRNKEGDAGLTNSQRTRFERGSVTQKPFKINAVARGLGELKEF